MTSRWEDIVPTDEDMAEVATWPPLTEAQLDRLALLLRPMARALHEIRQREMRAGGRVAA